MTTAHLIFAGLCFLFALLSVGGMVPLVAVGDHVLAVSRGRAAYDKMAHQAMMLALLANAVAAALLGADLAFDGFIASALHGVWLVVFAGTAVVAAVAALFSLVGLVLKGGLRYASYLAAALAGAAETALAMAVSWGVLRCRTGLDFQFDDNSFGIVLGGLSGPGFIAFAIVCFFAALSSAYGLLLCWHIVRRSADDYGRDYYSSVLSLRGRQGMMAGGALLLFGVVFLALGFGQSDAVRQLFGMWTGGMDREAGCAGCLALVPAVAFLRAVGSASVPMRRRSLAFAAVVFLLVALFSFFCLA